MKSGFETLAYLAAGSTALFLDFDGTLAEIADQPDTVRVDETNLHNLSRLFESLGGALAIITGREIADVDQFLTPHVFPASGVHGFELRRSGKPFERLPADTVALGAAEQALQTVTAQNHGLLLEKKPGSIALHYRARPELAGLCHDAVANAVRGKSALKALQGKMVFEIKSHSSNKGEAVATFLRCAPFHNRTPVFVGDDVTDEAAFEVVNAQGGISIKVGPGETGAHYRLEGPDAVSDWLARLADQFECGYVQGERAT